MRNRERYDCLCDIRINVIRCLIKLIIEGVMILKGIYKLTKGEIIKLVKSKIIYIMAGILGIFIAAFTVIYAFLPKNAPNSISSFIKIMNQGAPSAFDVYEAIVPTLTKGSDNPELEVFLSDDWKLKFVREKPYVTEHTISPTRMVLNEKKQLFDSFNFDKELLDFVLTDSRVFKLAAIMEGNGFDEKKLGELIPEKTLYDKIASKSDEFIMLALEIFEATSASDILSEGKLFTASQLETAIIYLTAFKDIDYQGEKIEVHNLINGSYNSDVGFANKTRARIEKEIQYFIDNNFEVSYVDYVKQALTTLSRSYIDFYFAYKEYIRLNSIDSFQSLTEKYLAMYESYSVFGNAISADTTEYNYLLYKSENFMYYPADYETLRAAAAPFNRLLSETNSVYNNLVKDSNVYNLLSGENGLLKSYAEISSDPLLDENNEVKQRLVNRYENIILSMNKPDSIFFNIKPENDSDEDINQAMRKYFIAIEESYHAVISQEFYIKHIDPYIKDLDKMGKIYNSLPEITDYDQLKRSSETLTSIGTTFKQLMINLNMKNVVKENNFSDAKTKKIFGMIFQSRYELERNITEAKYFLYNGKLSIDYATIDRLDNGWSFMNFAKVIILLLILIFSIVLASGMIAGEYSDGTMKLLLIRPYKKWQVLLSKILAVFLVALVFLIAAFILSLIIGFVGWGLEGRAVLSIFNATTPLILNQFSAMLLGYLFGFFEIMVYAMIALMVSTCFKSRSGAVSISMVIYFAAQLLSVLLGQFAWYKFILFNNTNLFMYFAGGPSLNDKNFLFSLAVTIIYTVIVIAASFFTFIKRDAA